MNNLVPVAPGTFEDRRRLMAQIEAVVRRIVEQIAENARPVIEVPCVDRNGRRHQQVERIAMCSRRSRKRFAVILKLLDEVHLLLETNITATKRDLFYRYVNFYESQTVVDRDLDAIARLLNVPRWRLNVLATSKGLIVGDLTFLESSNGAFIDCQASRNGLAIPSKVHELRDLRSQARFVLLVEKDAIFQKLIDENFLAKFNRHCILVTGKGYGDLATRQLLRRLRIELGLPIFALMDADPHGLDIFVTYAFGSPATLYNELLTVPDMQLIGVLAHEIASFNIAPDQITPLTANERTLLNGLAHRVNGDANLLRQVDTLQRIGVKMEIEGLYTLGEHYLVDQYLANKIVQHLPANHNQRFRF